MAEDLRGGEVPVCGEEVEGWEGAEGDGDGDEADAGADDGGGVAA